MRALVQDRYGSPDVLRVDDVPTPVPGRREILIRVKAASANARDWHVMRGEPGLARLLDSATFGRTAPTIRIRVSRLRLAIADARPSTQALAELAALVESGSITPIVDKTFALENAKDAIRYLEVEHARAKAVIAFS